jgi:hypothetical protein
VGKDLVIGREDLVGSRQLAFEPHRDISEAHFSIF